MVVYYVKPVMNWRLVPRLSPEGSWDKVQTSRTLLKLAPYKQSDLVVF